jgi:hypothetical protein
MVLAPGEGFLFRHNHGSDIPKTFVGEVAQGYLVNPVPNLYSFRASMVPQSGRITTDLLFPVMNGDSVMLRENGSYTTYTFNSGVWSPSEPVVGIGEAFWSYKNVGFWWTRNYLVWP